MPGKYGSNSFSVFLIGGYNMLAAKVQNVTRKIENVLGRTDGLGDNWEDHGPVNLGRAAFTQDGAFFDDSTNGMHQGLKAAPNTSRVGIVGNEGNVVGAAFTGFLGLIAASYEVLAQLAGLTKANAAYAVTGQVDEGVILEPHGPRTTTWNGPSVDNGASSAGGGVAYLEVSAYSGFTNVVVKVQDSVDNSVWVDHVTFATVTLAPKSERKTVGTTVNRYLRAIGTVTGSGSITLCVGFSRNADQ